MCACVCTCVCLCVYMCVRFTSVLAFLIHKQTFQVCNVLKLYFKLAISPLEFGATTNGAGDLWLLMRVTPGGAQSLGRGREETRAPACRAHASESVLSLTLPASPCCPHSLKNVGCGFKFVPSDWKGISALAIGPTIFPACAHFQHMSNLPPVNQFLCK